MVGKKTAEGKPYQDWAHPNHAAIFGFDEVGMLDARQAREGATITEYMKQGCSGTSFGRVLKGRQGVQLEPRSYRFGLFINIQPARGGLLFSQNAIAGGLPSRFLFFSTHDKLLRAERDFTSPRTIVLPHIDWEGVNFIEALPVMDDLHAEEQFKANEGKIEEIDSHLLLTRAKVAVALAVLDGRTSLIEEDWELSNVVIQHSKSTRQEILDALAQTSAQEITRQGRAAGIKATITGDVLEKKEIKKVARRILIHRANGHPETGMRRRIAKRSREYFEDAIEFLNTNPGWDPEIDPQMN
jgi:hypothetical protein